MPARGYRVIDRCGHQLPRKHNLVEPTLAETNPSAFGRVQPANPIIDCPDGGKRPATDDPEQS
jgi:hypothetical protein